MHSFTSSAGLLKRLLCSGHCAGASDWTWFPPPRGRESIQINPWSRVWEWQSELCQSWVRSGVETGQGWADRKLYKPDTGRDGGRDRGKRRTWYQNSRNYVNTGAEHTKAMLCGQSTVTCFPTTRVQQGRHRVSEPKEKFSLGWSEKHAIHIAL